MLQTPGSATPPVSRPPVPWHARRRLWLVVAVLTAVGYVTVAVVAIGRVYWEFHRPPTKGELYRAAVLDVRQRWRVWPASRIFPQSVPYTTEQHSIEHAQRVGIAPGNGCTSGVGPGPAGLLTQAGCSALLRATYVDETHGIVFTVGIAAFPDEKGAASASRQLPAGPQQPSLAALAFPGTLTARFDNAARQFSSVAQAGPYVVMTTAGQTDGRPAAAVVEQRASLFWMAYEAAGNIGNGLAKPAQPSCADKREWTC
jgi:hypothetical protein